MSKSTTNTQSTTKTNTVQEGGSKSYTTSGSSSDTHSSTHTEGGSVSHSVGGSNTQTQGGNTSSSESYGGNSSVGTGKSWASGQVSDRTQQKYNQATQDYVRSQNVENAYAALQGAMNNRPAFQSQYEDKLSEMYDKIMNREAFTYDFNKDAMYRQYKDMYTTQGKRAMQDTMGQLAAMNSGYGSSYAQTAGQQTYQNYLQELNNMLPQLRQQALEEYDREGNRLAQQYQLTNDAYNREYGQYRDATSDWLADRSFNQSNYQDERNFDYNQAMQDRNFWQNEYWQERNAEQSNYNTQQGENWNRGYQEGTNWSNSQSQNWQDTETRSWSDSDTYSHTDTSGWSNTDTTNWSNTAQTTNQTSTSTSTGTGSGSGSGSSAGNILQYGRSESLDALNQNERSAMIHNDDKLPNGETGSGLADMMRRGDQEGVGQMVYDLMTKGYKVGKKTLKLEAWDVANMLNNADAYNNKVKNKDGTYSTNRMYNYTANDVYKIVNEYENGNKTNFWG